MFGENVTGRCHAWRQVSVCALLLQLAGCMGEAPAADGGAVGQGTYQLRDLSKSEVLADFDQLVASFRGLYGPMQLKEQRYGFSFDALVSEYRARLVSSAATEPEYVGIFHEFLARFKDAHVSANTSVTPDSSRLLYLPFSVMPVAGTFVVYRAWSADAADGGATAEIARGDELISIDGEAAAELVTRFGKYVGIANPNAARHLAATYLTQRPNFLAADLAPGEVAVVRLRRADGSECELTVPWQGTQVHATLPAVPALDEPAGRLGFTSVSLPAAETTRLELASFGGSLPFYLSPQVKAAYEVSAPLGPSPQALARFQVSQVPAAAQQLYAVTYKYQGHKLLLLRIAAYDLQTEQESVDVTHYIQALLWEQSTDVEGLVLDETHNRGGQLAFVYDLLSVLANTPSAGFVQAMHADRDWISAYRSAAQFYQQFPGDDVAAALRDINDSSRMIESAYDQGAVLSAPVAFPGFPARIEPQAWHWTKPLLMLVDELSVSAAEFVALLTQVNGIAPLFGATTMGGGGTVAQVATLSNSRLELSLTRGVGTVFDASGEYPQALFIEDIGVSPDIAYEHTLEDFRRGYVGYVAAFSDAISRRLAN